MFKVSSWMLPLYGLWDNMGKLGLNSGYIGSDQRTTKNGVVGYDKFFLERKNGRFNPVLEFTGLLDLYSGAAAAYSLRKLSSTYDGSAIRVRRSSDNTELDIGFDGLGSLNTAALLTFCGAGDGFVTIWYDQSGNGYNATQTTASSQPKIYDSVSGVITKGSQPSILFDGIDDELSNSTQTAITDVSIISAVSSEDASQDGVSLMVNTSSGRGFSQGFGNLGTSDAFGTRSRSYSGDIFRGKSGTGTSQLLAFQTAEWGVTNTLYVDGVIENAVIGARNTQAILDFITIGSRSAVSYFNGKYSEAIIYLSDQSSNRTGIETNINDFYNIY